MTRRMPVLRRDDQIEARLHPVGHGNHFVATADRERAAGQTTHKTKVRSKARARAGGGTVSKTETTVEHKRPSAAAKTTTTETKEKDAKGDVVREEKKVDK